MKAANWLRLNDTFWLQATQASTESNHRKAQLQPGALNPKPLDSSALSVQPFPTAIALRREQGRWHIRGSGACGFTSTDWRTVVDD